MGSLMAANFLGLAKSLAALAKVPALISTRVAGDLNARLQAGFSAGTDPYGQAWAPLAPATLAKGRFPPPLTDTGALRGGAKLIPFPSGLRLGSTPGYGQLHMSGTSRMPKRRWFPDAGLPASWREIIQRHFSALVREGLAK